ncbi:hypothetical protein ACMBCN_02650 [Candidatus Liberibacter asiaticus]
MNRTLIKIDWAKLSSARITRKKWAGSGWVRASPISQIQFFIFIN